MLIIVVIRLTAFVLASKRLPRLILTFVDGTLASRYLRLVYKFTRTAYSGSICRWLTFASLADRTGGVNTIRWHTSVAIDVGSNFGDRHGT